MAKELNISLGNEVYCVMHAGEQRLLHVVLCRVEGIVQTIDNKALGILAAGILVECKNVFSTYEEAVDHIKLIAFASQKPDSPSSGPNQAEERPA